MATSKHNRHKQTKMGQLPGDIPRKKKIEMLEQKFITLSEHELDNPKFSEGQESSRIKSFRNKIKQKAESRFRQNEKREIQEEFDTENIR